MRPRWHHPEGAASLFDEPQEAAAAATLEPTPVSDQGKAAFEQVSTDLGATNESIDDIEQEIDAAKQHADDAEAQQQQQASGATDTAKAQLESFKAQTERGVQAPSARTGRPHFPFAGAPARCGRRLNLQRGATP